MAGKRILVTVRPELYDEIKQLAESRGVGMSTIVNLALQGGFIALKMANEPLYQAYFASGQDAVALNKALDKLKKGKKS